MAVIYLQHPVHGSKVACSDWEAEYDEQNGWERYNPEDPAPVEAEAPVNTLRKRRVRRTEADPLEGT